MYSLRIGGPNKRKGSKRNNLGKREFLPAVPVDGQYVLARAESEVRLALGYTKHVMAPE